MANEKNDRYQKLLDLIGGVEGKGKRDLGMNINRIEAQVRLAEEETRKAYGIDQTTLNVVSHALGSFCPEGVVTTARNWIIRADGPSRKTAVESVSKKCDLQKAEGLRGEERTNFVERVYWMLMARTAGRIQNPRNNTIDENEVKRIMNEMKGVSPRPAVEPEFTEVPLEQQWEWQRNQRQTGFTETPMSFGPTADDIYRPAEPTPEPLDYEELMQKHGDTNLQSGEEERSRLSWREIVDRLRPLMERTYPPKESGGAVAAWMTVLALNYDSPRLMRDILSAMVGGPENPDLLPGNDLLEKLLRILPEERIFLASEVGGQKSEAERNYDRHTSGQTAEALKNATIGDLPIDGYPDEESRQLVWEMAQRWAKARGNVELRSPVTSLQMRQDLKGRVVEKVAATGKLNAGDEFRNLWEHAGLIIGEENGDRIVLDPVHGAVLAFSESEIFDVENITTQNPRFTVDAGR